MKNIVNRALVAKKKQFLSKAVPRGTRTIWRYLGALFILFTFAVGNVLAADTVFKCKLNGSVVQERNDGNSEDFFSFSFSSGSFGWKGGSDVTGCTYDGVDYASAMKFDSKPTLSFTTTESATVIVVQSTSKNNSKAPKFDGTAMTSKTTITGANVWTITDVDAGSHNVRYSSEIWIHCVYVIYPDAGGCTAAPAAPTAFAAGSITEDGVTFTITDDANAGKYDIYYSTSSTAPEATTAASATSTAKTKAITGLTASTKYYAWVRSVCDDSHKSAWVALTGGFFTTAAPDPCTTHHWFVATADATANGKTNWDGFTNAVTGTNGQSNSVTIDGTTYNLTKRTGSTTGTNGIILGFTIPANKAGTLYGYMKSSGTGARTLSLKKGDEVVKTNTQISNGDWTLITIDAIAPGTYTLSPDQKVQVQMFVLKVCDATFHTITLDLDGGTGATSIQALDGVPATKPADPTKAHATFAGWVVKSTSAAYDWSANVTGDFTLKATWTQLYTVTYEAGDGTATGDAPTQADLANGEKFTVAANTFAVAGKDFVKWNDGTNDYAPGAEYTIASANVVLTAQWKAASAKYTVHYMDEDGTTPLAADELVEVTQKPVGLAEDPTKPLYTFAAWQLSGVDITLDAASWTSVAANTEVTLTARWAKAYATSYDMEAYAASDGASKAGLETALTAAGYAYTNINGIDNGHTHNYTYDGMKYKTNDGDLSFNVVAGKVVEVKTGHLPSNDAVTMYINGVADATVFEGADEEQETHKINYFYSAAEALYRLDVQASKGTCAVKKVTIRDPYTVSYNPHGADAIDAQNATPSVTLPTPVNGTGNFKGWYDAETEGNKIGNAGASYTPTANITLHAQWEVVSTDNTLSDLQVDGATVAGFDPEVQIYNLVYEYGQQPVITSATATAGALATVTINNTPVEEATFKYVQVKVEAESGAKRFYQVRYTNKPKQGATIFKAELTSNTAADYSGMYADGDNSEIKLADDGANGYKFSGTSNYVKMAIADATFAEGDMLKMTYTTNPQQGELAIYDGTTKLQGTAYSNHILTFSDAADGKSILFIRRTSDNNFNGWVAEVEVQRYMDPFIESFKIGEAVGTINESAKTIAIELPNGTSLSGVAATVEAYANGGATVTAPAALAYNTALSYTVSGAYAEDGDVVYTVTITEAEASHDATLSDIKLNGVSLTGFNSATLSYNVELEKGTLAYPTVTYTAATGATVVPNSETFPGAYNLVVTAQDGTTTQTYTIHFTVSTKDIITIFDGSTMDAIATSPDATSGASWEAVGLSVSSSNKVTGYTHIIATGGSTGTSKYIAVTIPENYAPQFVIAHATNSNGNERNAMIGTSNTRPALEDALFAVASSSSSSASESTSGVLSENTTYYIHADQSINFVKIQLILEQLAPKCEKPVISGLADVQVCDIASAELNGTATVADGGTVSYKWYAEGGTDVLATTATYTPTAVGNYYVVATNTLADHRDNSTTSEVVSVSLYEATSVTMSNISGKAAASIALNAVATGANPHYAWFTCDDAEGNNAVAIAGAADAASYAIPTPVATQYYKVVVTTDCGSVSAVALVTLLPDIVPLADVTESTVWDWSVVTKVADGSDLSGNGPTVTTGNGLVIANYLQGDDFDKIEGNNGAYSIRSSSNKFYQGASLHMHTTKGGILTIRARNEGHEMKLNVENEGRDIELGNLGNWKNYTIYVKAGDVTIYNVPAESTYPMRVEKITFTVKESPDYERPVSNNIGTLCVEHNVMVGGALGATFYQIASRNELYNDKIDFEEVLPNEELKAGEPYIFQSTTGKIELFFGETEAENPVEVRGMIGNFAAGHLDITDDNKLDILYIAKNKLWNCEDLVESGLILNDHRAYIKMSDVPTYEVYEASKNQQNAAPRRRVTIGGDAPAVTTGIENGGLINGENGVQKVLINGQIFILRGEKMYDATGRLVK